MFHKRGIKPDPKWDDYKLCMKLYDIRKRRFDLNIPYAVVFSDVLETKLRDFPWVTNIRLLWPYTKHGTIMPVTPGILRPGPVKISALEQFIINLETGKPVTDFLGSRVNAISVKKSDFEVKNWGIYHAHLDEKIGGKYSVNPDSNLLFFQVRDRVVHLIDIKKHPRGADWFDPELIEIVHGNWPWLLMAVSGIKLLNNVPDEEMYELSKRANVMYTLRNGLVVMPSNMGVATSGDSVEAVTQTDRLFKKIMQIQQDLLQNEQHLREEYQKQTGAVLGELITFHLSIKDNAFTAVGTDGDKTHAPAVCDLFPVPDTFFE